MDEIRWRVGDKFSRVNGPVLKIVKPLGKDMYSLRIGQFDGDRLIMTGRKVVLSGEDITQFLCGELPAAVREAMEFVA